MSKQPTQQPPSEITYLNLRDGDKYRLVPGGEVLTKGQERSVGILPPTFSQSVWPVEDIFVEIHAIGRMQRALGGLPAIWYLTRVSQAKGDQLMTAIADNLEIISTEVPELFRELEKVKSELAELQQQRWHVRAFLGLKQEG
jgi:hypothetical protein